MLQNSVKKPVYRPRTSVKNCFYRTPSQAPFKTVRHNTNHMTERSKTKIIESPLPKIMQHKSNQETIFQFTRSGEDHLTLTKSFRPKIQNPITKTTPTLISKQQQQQTTPLTVRRAPNELNPMLPKKCPWDSNPRIKIDFDKKNVFRSDLFDRFETVPDIPVTDTGICLPWNEKHWNFFITNVNGYDDISARLIGDEYSVSTFF